MTIAAAATKYRYLGNGVTTTFSYLNRVYAETDLKVDLLVRSTSALVETLTLTTDYTVTIAANGQATVTITNATKIPSATQDILLRLDLPLTQATELPTGTPFPAKSVENMVDKVTSIVQALAEVDTRTLKFNAQSPVTNAVIANPVADATLAFDGTTGAIKAGASLGDIANASANATAAAASAAAAAASAATIGGFDLSGTPAANDAILWDTGAAKFLRRTIAQLRSAVLPNITLPASGTLATLAGTETLTNKTLTSPVINGTTTNDSAGAGVVGEIQTSNVQSGSATSLVTGTAKTITSISLTAGDWDVRGLVMINPSNASTSFTSVIGGISTTNNALPPEPYFSLNIIRMNATAPGINAAWNLPTGTQRLSLASTTTVYLVAFANFTVSTATAYGSIEARRVR